MDIDSLIENNYFYEKFWVHPWDSLRLVDSLIPEPRGQLKIQILKNFELIYDSWKQELESKINEPFYLRLWICEPRISNSQIVCAIGDRIDHYQSLFVEDSRAVQSKSSAISNFTPGFNWSAKVDEDEYWESNLTWQGKFEREEDRINEARLLKRLKSGKYRKEEVTNENDTDTIYFLPRGTIWIGEK